MARRSWQMIAPRRMTTKAGHGQVDPRCFAGPGWQLPPGGGRTAADADAGLEVGIFPPPGPSPVVVAGEPGELLGARSAPGVAAGALPEKVAGGRRGAEPPAWR